MAITKVLSYEDRHLNTATLVGSRRKAFVDIDLSFAMKTTGDIYKKYDAASVKQSVKNIVLTNHNEKPFLPSFGSSVRDLLFELMNDSTSFLMEQRIKTAIENYEPRAQIININASRGPHDNELSATIVFKVINSDEEVSLNVYLQRLR